MTRRSPDPVTVWDRYSPAEISYAVAQLGVTPDSETELAGYMATLTAQAAVLEYRWRAFQAAMPPWTRLLARMIGRMNGQTR